LLFVCYLFAICLIFVCYLFNSQTTIIMLVALFSFANAQKHEGEEWIPAGTSKCWGDAEPKPKDEYNFSEISRETLGDYDFDPENHIEDVVADSFEECAEKCRDHEGGWFGGYYECRAFSLNEKVWGNKYGVKRLLKGFRPSARYSGAGRGSSRSRPPPRRRDCKLYRAYGTSAKNVHTLDGEPLSQGDILMHSRNGMCTVKDAAKGNIHKAKPSTPSSGTVA